jgi:5-methylcytosine-specific restriction endonuclease McrA
MKALSSISDADLVARMPALVLAERAALADVIEHLIEIDKRRLYLEQACPSLHAYCMRLGYSEEGTSKRVRVTRLAEHLPRVLDELRKGAVHLTALYLLAKHLTEDNCEALLAEARGKSKREIELLIARWFPRPDAEQRITPLTEAPASATPASQAETDPSGQPTSRARPGKSDSGAPFKLEPLSVSSYRIQFTASAELYAKLEKARELLSHAVPIGDLAALFERAIDELLERETKRRIGAGRPRKRRTLKRGSRHVPAEVKRAVWERDASQCTFVDGEGRRCSERRFLTLEHRHPFALGGLPTVENLCLLCASHNAYTARQVFGQEHISKKRREAKERIGRAKTDVFAKVSFALKNMGFRRSQVTRVITELREAQIEPEVEPLVRAALARLAPASA